jgi:signal transduction histidine kinase
MTPADGVPFEQNALLRALPLEALSKLQLNLAVVEFAAGDIIFEEQSVGDACYLVEYGTVRISKEAPGGGQETLAFIGPGEFFGELALFYAADRSARAIAATAVRTRTFYREDFERVRRIAPLELMTAIANASVDHLRHLNTRHAEYLADSDRFREVGVAIATIAHDTRSPLATIQNAADLLHELIISEEKDVEQMLRFCTMIERTSRKALDNIDDLLAGVRGDQGSVEAEAGIGELVHEISLQLQGVIRARNVTFQTVVNCNGNLLCERRQLVRALVNLVRNALEAVPDGTGSVQLQIDRAEDVVVFTVSDTGCGIPIEHQGRIFERRFTHGKKGGTGLGLHQVRNAIEQHHGTIALESRPGEGTTFRIHIPERRQAPAGT